MKNCNTCENKHDSLFEEPYESCRAIINNEEKIKKDCSTCIFGDYDWKLEPCFSCAKNYDNPYSKYIEGKPFLDPMEKIKEQKHEFFTRKENIRECLKVLKLILDQYSLPAGESSVQPFDTVQDFAKYVGLLVDSCLAVVND